MLYILKNNRYFFRLFLFLSCKENKHEETKTPYGQKEEQRNIEDFVVFQNLLQEQNILNAEYNNIKFDKSGASFSKDISTYIRIPFSDLNLNEGFNVSFSFKTTDDDGTKPQSLIAFVDKFSTANRIPFYVFFPGNKVSGVYGEQLFWAENYDAENGNSRAYYDSFKLSKNQFYFVSVNFDGNKAEIFVNSESYALFEDLKKHDLKFDNILIGALLQNNVISKPLAGNIHGLKIFRQPLSEKEIVSLFNSQPEIIEGYN